MKRPIWCACVPRHTKVQAYAPRTKHESGSVQERRVTMTTGVNVPGDREIVEILIVHFQSSIKFNSHSASTCYSYSVTVYLRDMQMFLCFCFPPSSFFHIFNDTLPPFTPPLLHHPPESVHGCVNITDDPEHMCVSLWRLTIP